jgi:hypothetical protein
MALDADTERHAQVERFFVGEAQLSCEFMKPDLGGQSDSLVGGVRLRCENESLLSSRTEEPLAARCAAVCRMRREQRFVDRLVTT